ncbi:hypothetical protein BDW02DRAFT_516223 [Decorospora gaudefroyi]|uniref:Uncharacterized protein n=1 Tax=Decorospora gaudefroyi TaxID=184978 RepID=A0A6A5KR91_9PLEO|nr:hypothetical protein BDW02DRAFT_516223 [Decorospora gaudefroyi]
MAVSIAETQLPPAATPKARLLSSLVRHVSAPASPRPSLSSAQLLASRLRRDRDKCRSLAHKQAHDLTAAHVDLKQQADRISELEEENARLQARHKEDTTVGRQLHFRFHDLVNKYDKLSDQFNQATHTIARIKKSDRSKDKVQQRNLRLKATLRRCMLQGTSATTQAATDTEATLREALAIARDRIEELESYGEAMLETLVKRNDSCDSERECDEEDDGQARVVEEMVLFRGVLEDGLSTEEKENWAALLNE